MGVNGLFPFLRQKCPEVIKELQGGLKALSGKTVVIDGTLITQRFHLAQSSLKRRSVVRWYRLINDMRSHGVNPICIFDGKERNAAKRREVLRRRAGRLLATVRGDLEDQRLERLSKMHDTIRALKNLSDEEKKCVTRKLKAVMKPAPTTPSTVSTEPQIEVEIRADPADIIGLLLSSEEQDRAAHSPVQKIGQPGETEKASLSVPVSHVEPLQTETDDTGRLSISSFTPPVQPDVTLPPSGNVQDESIASSKENAPEKGGEPLETMADTLAKLYKEYQDSVATFNGAITPSEFSSVATGDVPIFLSSTLGPSGVVDSEVSNEESSITLRASKNQREVMDMESEAWSLLSSAANTSTLAPWKDVTATGSVLLPDQPMNIPANQSSATLTADGEATAEVVGAISDTVDQMDSDKVDHVDSRPPKSATPSTPAQFVEQAEETFHNVGLRSEAIAAAYKRRINAPTEQTYREAQSLLHAMGVPVVITEGGEEAEAVASALVLEGIGDYVATEDTDVLIHGAKMLRNITSHQMKDSSLVTISGLEVRRALEIPTQRAYIDFALLLGTDFTERIKKLGPVTAHEFIKEYGSIENVIKLIQGEDVRPAAPKKAPIIEAGKRGTDAGKKPKKPKGVSRYTIRYPPSEYLAHVQMGREVYSTHPPTPAKDMLKQKPLDDAALSALLCEWRLDRDQLESLDGEIVKLGEGSAWETGEDGDIYKRFGGSLDWEEPWEY